MTGSDAALVTASVREPGTFGQVFDRHVRAVHAYVARRLGDDLADDATAETFRLAFERRATFDAARGDVRPWLLGIATNVARHHQRDEERRLRALGRVAPDGAAGEPSPLRRPPWAPRSRNSNPAIAMWCCWWPGRT